MVEAKVNVPSNFSKSLVERVFDESEHMLKHDANLRETAKVFGVSATTVWNDMRKRLPLINPIQYDAMNILLDKHRMKRGR